MIKNINITRFLKLLLIIPTVLLLFACSSKDDNSTIFGEKNGAQNSQQEEVRQRECWQQAVVNVLYDTVGRVAMGMYNTLSQGAMALMMVAFSLWLCFRILKHVGSFSEESPAEVWTEVMKKFFICFVCGWLASSSTAALWVLNSIIFPVYNAFLELGSEMLGYFGKNNAQGSMQYNGRMLFIPFEGEIEATYNAACTVGNMDPATLNSFPAAPKQMMGCMVCAVNERLNFGYKLGWVILAQPGFMALICGLIMLLLFTFIKIAFVFYLVDSIFRFAMMVLMLPLLIMAYAFEPTKKWTSTGFVTILNSAAFMLCIAVVVLISMAAIQQILIDNKEVLQDKTTLSDFSKPLLMLMLTGFLLLGSMNIAHSIAQGLVGGGGDMNFQKQLGALLAKAGTWAFKKGAGAIISRSKKLQSARESYDRIKGKLHELAGDK